MVIAEFLPLCFNCQNNAFSVLLIFTCILYRHLYINFALITMYVFIYDGFKLSGLLHISTGNTKLFYYFKIQTVLQLPNLQYLITLYLSKHWINDKLLWFFNFVWSLIYSGTCISTLCRRICTQIKLKFWIMITHARYCTLNCMYMYRNVTWYFEMCI